MERRSFIKSAMAFTGLVAVAPSIIVKASSDLCQPCGGLMEFVANGRNYVYYHQLTVEDLKKIAIEYTEREYLMLMGEDMVGKLDDMVSDELLKKWE